MTADWPPDAARQRALGHSPECLPPRDPALATRVVDWRCVPGCKAAAAYAAKSGSVLPGGSSGASSS